MLNNIIVGININGEVTLLPKMVTEPAYSNRYCVGPYGQIDMTDVVCLVDVSDYDGVGLDEIEELTDLCGDIAGMCENEVDTLRAVLELNNCMWRVLTFQEIENYRYESESHYTLLEDVIGRHELGRHIFDNYMDIQGYDENSTYIDYEKIANEWISMGAVLESGFGYLLVQ